MDAVVQKHRGDREIEDGWTDSKNRCSPDWPCLPTLVQCTCFLLLLCHLSLLWPFLHHSYVPLTSWSNLSVPWPCSDPLAPCWPLGGGVPFLIVYQNIVYSKVFWAFTYILHVFVRLKDSCEWLCLSSIFSLQSGTQTFAPINPSWYWRENIFWLVSA